jgi:chromosome segregation ATPase
MDDAELLSLDLDGARDYLLAWATTIKRYDQDLAALDATIGTWRSRIDLAASKGQAELAEAAKAKAEELEAQRASLALEKEGLSRDLSRLKERIPYLKSRQRSIDPDRLLAELQAMTGDILEAEPGATAALDAELEKTEKQSRAEDALAELKRRMGEGTA